MTSSSVLHANCVLEIIMCVKTTMVIFMSIEPPPLPSNRHHWSIGDCLEGKRQNYRVYSVQFYVQQLCTARSTHIWKNLTVLWIGFCLTGPISLCLDLFLCMYVFHVSPYIACCSIVTWSGGPGGIEAWSLGLLLPSVLCRCWLGHLPHKNPSLIWPILCFVGR